MPDILNLIRNLQNQYSCMSLYMRWPLRNFNTFNHLVDSYRNTISELAVGFRYGYLTLKLAGRKKSLVSCVCEPMALGSQDFLPVGKFLEVKKYPYLKLGPFGILIFILLCNSIKYWTKLKTLPFSKSQIPTKGSKPGFISRKDWKLLKKPVKWMMAIF